VIGDGTVVNIKKYKINKHIDDNVKQFDIYDFADEVIKLFAKYGIMNIKAKDENMLIGFDDDIKFNITHCNFGLSNTDVIEADLNSKNVLFCDKECALAKKCCPVEYEGGQP